MLILVRREQETIHIGDKVVVTLVAIDRGSRARIGITAPINIAVDRERVRHPKMAEQARGIAIPPPMGSGKMLILGCRWGERFYIGDEITVMLMGIHGAVARIGIDAPLDVRILRGEIYETETAE